MFEHTDWFKPHVVGYLNNLKGGFMRQARNRPRMPINSGETG